VVWRVKARSLSARGCQSEVYDPSNTLSRTVEVVTAVIRITSGNFRLLQRLFAQIARVLTINHLVRVTKDIVETAREGLVVGTT
jgi:hypothetical protein